MILFAEISQYVFMRHLNVVCKVTHRFSMTVLNFILLSTRRPPN
jgi:hypothetical protein